MTSGLGVETINLSLVSLEFQGSQLIAEVLGLIN